MPSSSLTFSSIGPTFCTALRIFAGSVSSVRAQKSSASGLSSISVGLGGVYFVACLAMTGHSQKKGPLARASLSSRSLLACDLPDRPGAGNLHKRRVRRVDEPRARIGPARVAHRAIVHQVRGAVGPEADRGRPIDAARLHHERLLGFAQASWRAVRIMRLLGLPAVEGEARKPDLVRVRGAREVHQLHVV